MPGWLLLEVLPQTPTASGSSFECGPSVCMSLWTLRRKEERKKNGHVRRKSVETKVMRLHVIGHVDGIQLVGQEPVPQVHPLFFSPGVDGDDTDVYHDYYAYNQVMFFQDHIGHQGNQVQGFLLWPIQFNHNH